MANASQAQRILLRAALFAADKHRLQKRKDADASPYINHPLAVAEVMARHGVTDSVALQAALLHDTIEDTETTPEELEREFGPEVASVVLEVSDDKSLDKQRRKELQIEHAPSLSERAKLLKLGDKICNVLDVASNPPADWDLDRRREYLDWTEAVVRGCRGVNAELDGRYDEVLTEARRALGEAGPADEPAYDATPPSGRDRRSPLPGLVAHADWGSNPSKRWMCLAELGEDESYWVRSPEPVGQSSTLLARLHELADGGPVLVGFDFPIGLPAAYAERAGIESFRDVLPDLGQGRWSQFYDVAESADEISVARPFYPQRPGGTKQRHLLDALGVASMTHLLRVCERATDDRGAASPLFWTLGGTQVGKAAILGWREVLAPALRDENLDVSIWPFDGELTDLLGRGGIVVVETYPAEGCRHLGMTPPGRGWSKRSHRDRRARCAELRSRLESRPLRLSREVERDLAEGFGSNKHGEDPFDAMIGLLSMLEVVLGYREDGAPQDKEVTTVEGWILGQARG